MIEYIKEIVHLRLRPPVRETPYSMKDPEHRYPLSKFCESLSTPLR